MFFGNFSYFIQTRKTNFSIDKSNKTILYTQGAPKQSQTELAYKFCASARKHEKKIICCLPGDDNIEAEDQSGVTKRSAI